MTMATSAVPWTVPTLEETKTLGRRSIAWRTCVSICLKLMPKRSSIGLIRLSDWESRAASKCRPSICCCPFSCAAICALMMASCDL